jgi:hypothetical protein
MRLLEVRPMSCGFLEIVPDTAVSSWSSTRNYFLINKDWYLKRFLGHQPMRRMCQISKLSLWLTLDSCEKKIWRKIKLNVVEDGRKIGYGLQKVSETMGNICHVVRTTTLQEHGGIRQARSGRLSR